MSGGGEGRTFVGTEGYIPPEGPGSPVADLYALGIVLYEASTGFPPERFPDVPPEWFESTGGDDALELHEVILDHADGLDWPTLCKCDLVYAVLKNELSNRRGVVSPERRRAIAERLIRGLGLAGL